MSVDVLKISHCMSADVLKIPQWVGVGGFSKVVATFSHFNLFMATTRDVWIIPSFRIWDYLLHVEHVSCVIMNCGQPQWVIEGGWGCEVSCGGHHRPRGKTTTGSALDGAVFDIAQILAYLVHNMSRSQLYLGFGHFGWLPFFGQ